MKRLFCLAAMTLCIAASAQDLKPVKDRESKKYGYQDKEKNWVITPAFDNAKKFIDGCAIVTVSGREGLIDTDGRWILPAEYDDIGKFDRNGLCELMIKEGKTKFRGIADQSGTIVLPVAYRKVDIPRNGGCILASNYPDQDDTSLWGVWDLQGREIYEPQFISEPSVSNGTLIARAVSGLYGVAGLDGKILLPFEYLAISRYGSDYHTLEKDFSRSFYNSDLRRTESFIFPHSFIPYDPMDDAVRAAAWHSGCIGVRLYSNQVSAFSLQSGYGSRNAFCRTLGVDWGRGRFIRLEPFVTDHPDTDAMSDPVSGNYYTLRALLYEADGSLAEVLSDHGWLEAECAEGFIYNAGGKETWLVHGDPNALALPSYTFSLNGYRTIVHDNVYNGLGIRPNDLERLYSSTRHFSDRCISIIEGENIGVTSYITPAVDIREARLARDVMRGPLFQHAFMMGEVVNCDTRLRGQDLEVILHNDLVCRFEDHFHDPSYSMRGDELIWWGPHNARTIRLGLRATGAKDALTDDVASTGRFWEFELSMYEEDGTWLRTLARAPFADYAQNGIIIFKGLGIALVAPDVAKPSSISSRRTVLLKDAQPLPHTVSALEGFKPHRGPGGPGGPGGRP